MQIGLRTCVSAVALSSALAVLASPAAAVPTNISGQPAAAPKPNPAASWHGRPIRRPAHDGTALVAAHRGAASQPVAFGAGYGRPGGSEQVKEIQRLLIGIGYRPGPVDGMYGPLTRSSVQWFQIKHSLRPSGVVDAVTLALLRLRSHGASPPTMPTTAPSQTAPAKPAALAAPSSPAAAHKSSDSSAAPAVLAGSAVALALLLLMFVLLRRRRGRREAPPSAAEQPGAPEPPRPLPAPGQPERVVAYTRGRNPRVLSHQAETIERACSERGWTLAQVVRERRNGNGQRPGLRFALSRLADGGGTRLVACRVQDVGRNRDELAALLGWCARNGVDLVALDVGLDTSTRSGRRVARSLLSPGKRAPFGRSLRRRRGHAPGVDGELAPSSSP